MKRPAEEIKIDLISGSPVRGILLLSFPIIISNLMHVLYNIADTAWLGLLGKEEVAAMAFAFPIFFLILSIGIGVGIAGSVLVAQHEGAGNKEEVNRAAGQTLSYALILSLIISVAGYFSAGSLVELMGAAPEVKALAETYLKIIFSGVVLVFSFFIFNALMRAWGNSKTPMKIVIWSNVANLVLDPLLIFGIWIFPRMGIAGAAVATIASKFGASAVAMWLLFKGPYGLSLDRHHLIPDRKTIKKLTVLGWPAVVEHATKGLGMMFVTAVAAVFGTSYMAGYSVGVRIFSVFVMPSLALGEGAAASVGQNLGAGLKKRSAEAARMSVGVVFLLLSFLGAMTYLFRFTIASFFLGAGEPEAVAYGARFISRLAIAAPFLGASITFRGAFKGAGRTFQSMVIGITGMWIFRVGAAWIGGVVLASIAGPWNAFIIGSIGEFALCLGYYLRGSWLTPVIERAPSPAPTDITSDLT